MIHLCLQLSQLENPRYRIDKSDCWLPTMSVLCTFPEVCYFVICYLRVRRIPQKDHVPRRNMSLEGIPRRTIPYKEYVLQLV